jgi:hypothetical protein
MKLHLLNPDQSFKSFGYRAQNDYTELLEEPEEASLYYYVKNFKMQPHNRVNYGVVSHPAL